MVQLFITIFLIQVHRNRPSLTPSVGILVNPALTIAQSHDFLTRFTNELTTALPGITRIVVVYQ